MAQRIVVPGFDEQDAIALALLWYSDPALQVSPASPLPWVWVVSPEPYWIWEGNARGPILLSADRWERLRWPKRTRVSGRDRGDPRPATVPVLLDSGAFSVIDRCGCWPTTPEQYVAFVRRAISAVGPMVAVATQDWMCEPHMIARTGLSVAEHQRRTVESFLRLRELAPEVPWMPTLQGYTVDDYLRCIEMFIAAGVDLAAEALVGLGSVCRRSSTPELVAVICAALRAVPGINLHGFGVKGEGTLLSCLDLRSVDSDAWSIRGRGMEAELRAAVGLPAKAPRAELVAAMAAQAGTVDLEALGLFEWMRDADLRSGLQNSLAWAEVWRARQQCRIATAAMQRAAQIAEDTFPGQLRLRW